MCCCRLESEKWWADSCYADGHRAPEYTQAGQEEETSQEATACPLLLSDATAFLNCLIREHNIKQARAWAAERPRCCSRAYIKQTLAHRCVCRKGRLNTYRDDSQHTREEHKLRTINKERDERVWSRIVSTEAAKQGAAAVQTLKSFELAVWIRLARLKRKLKAESLPDWVERELQPGDLTKLGAYASMQWQ